MLQLNWIYIRSFHQQLCDIRVTNCQKFIIFFYKRDISKNNQMNNKTMNRNLSYNVPYFFYRCFLKVIPLLCIGSHEE